MTTTRRAYLTYKAAEKAYNTAHRRFVMVARLCRARITKANCRAYDAALSAARAASDAWLEAGVVAA